jgi:hypothetical protein
MRHRRRRPTLSPSLERVEPLVLLSNITDLMVQNADAADNRALRAFQSGAGVASASTPANLSGFTPSTTSIAVPENQGPQGTNLALMPTGTLTPREQKREHFTATFTGHYTTGAGQFSSEALLVHIKGVGGATTIRHADIQIRIVKPVDPSLPNSGVLAIFDRNLNGNSSLGLDFSAPSQAVDRGGRPNSFDQVSLDANISAGAYVEGFAQGVIQIHYIPSGKKTPGVFSQGTAIVKIQAQIYTTGVAFLLANSNINP